jgi:hypothetical protein
MRVKTAKDYNVRERCAFEKGQHPGPAQSKKQNSGPRIALLS